MDVQEQEQIYRAVLVNERTGERVEVPISRGPHRKVERDAQGLERARLARDRHGYHYETEIV